MRTTAAICMTLATLAGGCSLVVGNSIDPFEQVDFTGDYNLSVTNGTNGCEFRDWRVGDTASGVPLELTQDGEEVTGVLGGLWGTLADLVLGNRRATGTASGNHMSIRLVGTRTLSVEGGCTAYQIDAVLEGDLEGDYLSGTNTYTAHSDNGSVACVELDGCETIQNFNGTRAPQ